MQEHHLITLAVFPFEDLSPLRDTAIFCRAFSEDLITELSRFRQLSVVRSGRHFSPAPHPEDQSPHPNTYFVQGTFRAEKDRIRINVQLYARESQRLIWGQRFEDQLDALTDMQDRLLKNVVAVLQQQIDLDLLSRIKQRPRVAFSAYEHWLHGMNELRKGSLEADLKAREHFQKAMEIQPDYALACTGMSLSYFNEWTCQLWDRWDISKSGAYDWARRAIELDDQDHIAAMVLGRIFLYEGSYNTAEYYFRRSLQLNSNDPNSLFTISLYMVYLGLGHEALELYERALQLHPHYSVNHIRLGGFIYFELGEFEKAASYILHPQPASAMIADTDAHCAAIFYYLKQYDKMQEYWASFVGHYRRLNHKEADIDPQEPITWLLKLNPHRYKTNMEEFLQFISEGRFVQYPLVRKSPARDVPPEGQFIKDQLTWTFVFDGESRQATEVKGFHDIAKLLSQPRQLFHCAELMGTTLDERGEKLIDEKARARYKKKIMDLQAELEEAEAQSHYSRIEQLQDEYDQLVSHLSSSLNLKGGIRESGGPIGKARSAVTWRIRNAIARIEQHHPALGAHLSNSIKTGTFCTYKPDREIRWVTG